MGQIKQVRFCGLGGQGVVLAGTILGHAAIHDDKWVYGSDEYGAQARGGSAESEVIIATEPVNFPHVIHPDILVSLSQSAYDTYIEDRNERKALIIYDDHHVSPKEAKAAQQIGIPATHTAIHELHTKQVTNIVILGAMAAITDIVTKQALISSITENIAERFKELNLKALEIGYGLGNEKHMHFHTNSEVE